MILFSHPTGSTMARQSLQALYAAELLETFWTTFGFSETSEICKILPQKIIDRRSYRVPPSYINASYMREIGRLLFQKMRLHYPIRHEEGFFCIDRIFEAHDARVAHHIYQSSKNKRRGVYGYEDSCLKTFEAAKSSGLSRIYELPIAYWETSQKLLKEEAERLPEWEPTLGGNRDSEYKNTKKTQEIMLAETILCPSQFVKRSIPESILANKRCFITPYGSPLALNQNKGLPSRKNKKLKILFAGSLTQRKGLADLFSAMKLLNRSDIELIVFGHCISPLNFYREQYSNFTYKPPRSNREVLRLMQSCDLLVLPSISEGRAIVQLEALSCGLPLIITPNTGGDDLIEEGKTGFLVPIRAPQAIAEKINWYADNKQDLPDIKNYCMQRSKAVSWEVFRQKIVQAVQASIDP